MKTSKEKCFEMLYINKTLRYLNNKQEMVKRYKNIWKSIETYLICYFLIILLLFIIKFTHNYNIIIIKILSQLKIFKYKQLNENK